MVVALRLKIDRQEAIYSLLNLEEEAPYWEVMGFFVSGETLSIEQARAYWEVLLEYRREMSQTYGDRVSLNIAIYHLTRDPDRLARIGLAQAWSCSKLVQTLAIQELKAWWERCSETGLLLKEVMDQQLERLVYHGLKQKATVSLGLVELVSEKEIKAELRSEVASFLMNSCRCRDIVGHYQENRFALIFPQTPRAGSRVAVQRLQEFFQREFPGAEAKLMVAIASSPENGNQGRDLLLLAGDTLGAQMKLLEKGKAKLEDVILECEGESPPLYRWWTFHLKEPTMRSLRSPKCVASVIILVLLAILSVPHLNFQTQNTWSPVLVKEWELRSDLHRWRWGRGGSDAFELQEQDGFVVGGSQLLMEASENVWFRSVLSAEGSLKVNFEVEVHPASVFLLELKEVGKRAEYQIRLTHESVEWSLEGVTVLRQSLVSPGDHRFNVLLKSEPEFSRLEVNGETLVEAGPGYVRRSPWPGQCYVRAERGWSLLGKLEVQSKNFDEETEEDLFADVPLTTRMLELGRDAPLEAWFDLMDDQRSGVSEILLSNILNRVRRSHARDPQATLDLLMKRGRGLSLDSLWPKLLKGVSATSLLTLFTEGDLFRHRLLGVVHEAQRGRLGPSISLESSLSSGSWGNGLPDMLDAISVIDWGDGNESVGGWVASHRWELARSEDVSLSFEPFLKILKGPTPSDPNLRKEILDKAIFFADHDPYAVYLNICKHLEEFPKPEKKGWVDSIRESSNPMEVLLVAKYHYDKNVKDDAYNKVERWIRVTDFGKILYYDWLWLGVEEHLLASKDTRANLLRLTSQSRRDDLARLALAFQSKNGGDAP